MNQFTFIIPDLIKTYIMHQMRELCGDLFLKGNELFINEKSLVEGEFDEQGRRESCTNKEYSGFIFHTHPRTSYSVPSVEDIAKVVKNIIIKNSIVITLWGVFQIIKTDKNNSPLDHHDTDKIRETIDYINIKTTNPEYDEVKRNNQNREGITKNMYWMYLTYEQKRIVIEGIKRINEILRGREEIGRAEIYFNPFEYYHQNPKIYYLVFR